jgi:hypothetical protein
LEIIHTLVGAVVSTSSRPTSKPFETSQPATENSPHSPPPISSPKFPGEHCATRPGRLTDTIPPSYGPFRPISASSPLLTPSCAPRNFRSLTIARMSAASEDPNTSLCSALFKLYPTRSELPGKPTSDTEFEGDPSLLPSDLGPGAQRYNPASQPRDNALPTALCTRRR